MHPHTLHSCLFASPVHLMVQIAFGNMKQSGIIGKTVKHSKIIFHLVTEKLRQIYHTIAFLCFRGSDDILAIDALVGFADCQLTLYKVKIRFY